MRALSCTVLGLTFVLMIVSCDSEILHDADKGTYQTKRLLIDCQLITYLRSSGFQTELNIEISNTADLLNDGVAKNKPDDFLGTLCNAMVERVFIIHCNRRSEFGLQNPRLSLELNYPLQRKIITVHFGSKTPDGFGQYIFLTSSDFYLVQDSDTSFLANPENVCDTPSGTESDRSLLAKVLVIPAYHSRQLMSGLQIISQSLQL